MARDAAHTAQQKRKLLDMLKTTLGVVETACQRTGIGRRTHYDWLKKDAKYRAEVADIEDVWLDFGETQLQKLMQGYSVPDTKVFLNNDSKKPITVPITKHIGPDASAVIFFLKSKGKGRGYVEKSQVEHSGHIGGVKVTIHKGKGKARG
jgi:hypothetical protein